MIATHKQLAAAFNEWARLYADDPDTFGLLLDDNGKPYKDYGDQCVAYLLLLLLKTLDAGAVAEPGDDDDARQP